LSARCRVVNAANRACAREIREWPRVSLALNAGYEFARL